MSTENQPLTSTDAAQEWAGNLYRGDRVLLRGTTEADLPTLIDWWNDPTTSVFQRATTLPLPVEDLKAQFTQWSKNDSASGVGLSVVDALDPEVLLGHVSAWGMTGPARVATMAVMLGPQFTGQGFGRDTLNVFLRVLFDELGARKVQLQVMGFNDRAIKAYLAAGFVQEGRIRAFHFHAGQPVDEVYMGILESEYRARA